MSSIDNLPLSYISLSQPLIDLQYALRRLNQPLSLTVSATDFQIIELPSHSPSSLSPSNPPEESSDLFIDPLLLSPTFPSFLEFPSSPIDYSTYLSSPSPPSITSYSFCGGDASVIIKEYTLPLFATSVSLDELQASTTAAVLQEVQKLEKTLSK